MRRWRRCIGSTSCWRGAIRIVAGLDANALRRDSNEHGRNAFASEPAHTGSLPPRTVGAASAANACRSDATRRGRTDRELAPTWTASPAPWEQPWPRTLPGHARPRVLGRHSQASPLPQEAFACAQWERPGPRVLFARSRLNRSGRHPRVSCVRRLAHQEGARRTVRQRLGHRPRIAAMPCAPWRRASAMSPASRPPMA